MQAYDNYKDSGIEWLGKIPVHWEVEKGKWMFEKNERPVLPGYDVITCFRDGQVTLRKKRREDGFTNSLKEIGYQGIAKGDLIIHQMDAFAGAIGVSDSEGKSTPVYSVCSPRASNINNFYYAYFLRNMALSGLILSLAKGIRERSTDFRFNDFANLFYPLPPIKEQETIATFLDEKCGQLDEAARIKQQQIEKLKELRQITIHNAVTKGVNPNAEMKDSGIDWIGEIPKHWEVKRLKNICNLGKGLTITKENLQDTGILCVNYGEIHSKYGFEVDPLKHSLKHVDVIYLNKNKQALLKRGDFLFADTSEDLEGSGNFTYLNSSERVLAGYHTVIAKPIINIISRFLAYEFDSVNFRNQVRTKVKGVKVYSITQSILKDSSVWLPPICEQEQIATYLDVQTVKIDRAITQKTEQIAKLNEYKQSLINDVVTGKIKVVN